MDTNSNIEQLQEQVKQLTLLVTSMVTTIQGQNDEINNLVKMVKPIHQSLFQSTPKKASKKVVEKATNDFYSVEAIRARRHLKAIKNN